MAKTYYDSGRPIKVKGPGEFTGISEKALKEEAKRQRLAKTKARVKAKKSLKTFTVDPKTMPKPRPGKGVNKLGNVSEATQSITRKGSFKELKGAGVPKYKPTLTKKVTPVYKGNQVKQKFIGTKVTDIKSGKSVFTPKGKVTQTGAKAAAKVVGKTVAKGASRLIPGLGTAMIAKDIYDFTKWAAKQPKKSTKPYKYGSNY